MSSSRDVDWWDDMPMMTSVFQPESHTSSNGKVLYFGTESQGKSSLVDVRTGKEKDFLPTGYTILNKMDYKMFAPYLIVQKDDGLYSYNVESKVMVNIFKSSPDLKLKENEWPLIYPSMTEKDKFLIQIDAMGDEIVDHMYGLPEVLGTRMYTYDASSETVVKIKNKRFEPCTKYDSLNQRLFSWVCGEGVGSATPLSVRDMSDLTEKKQIEVVTASDIGLNPDDWARVDYEAGLFLISRHGKDFQIMIVDPRDKNLSQETFTATTGVADMLNDLSPYSIVFDRATHTFAVGGANYIVLLTFDDNHQIIKSTFLPDVGVYANFLYVNAGKVYYVANDRIRIVDIIKQKIERTILVPDRLSEVTLFFL
ncbi:MAG: hypothetical protein Q8P11_02695 [bacterium]|nr:hypothetical protein [bacterium]